MIHHRVLIKPLLHHGVQGSVFILDKEESELTKASLLFTMEG